MKEDFHGVGSYITLDDEDFSECLYIGFGFLVLLMPSGSQSPPFNVLPVLPLPSPPHSFCPNYRPYSRPPMWRQPLPHFRGRSVAFRSLDVPVSYFVFISSSIEFCKPFFLALTIQGFIFPWYSSLIVPKNPFPLVFFFLKCHTSESYTVFLSSCKYCLVFFRIWNL
jgi:hypothetical protein